METKGRIIRTIDDRETKCNKNKKNSLSYLVPSVSTCVE